MWRRLAFVVAGLMCIGAVNSFSQNDKVRICNNEHCLRTTQLIKTENDKGETIILPKEEEKIEKHEDDKIIEYISLVFTITVPLVGLFWWIINSQQEKKMLEFAQKQEDEFRGLVQMLLDKQDQNVSIFTQELKELNKKVDTITENFSNVKLNYMENLYKQNEKISLLTSEFDLFKKYMKKVDTIEGYLHKIHPDYIPKK